MVPGLELVSRNKCDDELEKYERSLCVTALAL